MNGDIREAREEDLDLVYYFIKEIAKYEKMEDEVVGTKESLRDWLFVRKLCKVIFVMHEGKEVGFALYFYNFSTFQCRAGVYLEDLFVLEEYRKLGYGKKLLLTLVKEAKDLNLGRVEWVCLNWNQPSIDFYRSLGAISMDDWKTYRLTRDVIEKLV